MRRCVVLLACLATAFAGAAHASKLTLYPTTLVADPSQKAQALTLVNEGDNAMRFQAQLSKWTLAGGDDALAPTSEILASPLIVEVPPHARRVIRVVRMAGTGNAYYRLLLKQLPEPVKPGEVGVRTLVNHDLPVAFEPDHAPLPPVAAVATASGYEVSNGGTVAARITLIGVAGAAPWKQGALGWVLPGAMRHFAYPTGAASLALTVNGRAVIVPVK